MDTNKNLNTLMLKQLDERYDAVKQDLQKQKTAMDVGQDPEVNHLVNVRAKTIVNELLLSRSKSGNLQEEIGYVGPARYQEMITEKKTEARKQLSEELDEKMQLNEEERRQEKQEMEESPVVDGGIRKVENTPLFSPSYAVDRSNTIIVLLVLLIGLTVWNGITLDNRLSRNTGILDTSSSAANAQGQGGKNTIANPPPSTIPPTTQPAAQPTVATATDMSGVTLEYALGKSNAPVTIVEFGDFQCPFCERWYQQVKKPLIKDYVDTGKVRFIFKPYAFLGADSTTAAEGLYCAADQNKFWEYHDYLYENQGQENGGWATADNIKKIAKTLGFNTTTFDTCLDTNKYKDKVAQTLAEGQKIGVNGTPASFINGESVPGAQPYTTFKDAIDKILNGQ